MGRVEYLCGHLNPPRVSAAALRTLPSMPPFDGAGAYHPAGAERRGNRAYGSRPRHRSDENSPPPSSSNPAAANPALISRFSLRVPIWEPSRW